MSIAKDILVTDVAYSAWATQQLLDACSALTADELERHLNASHGSIVGTLRHIYYGERAWSSRLRANALPPLDNLSDPEPFPDLPSEPDLEVLKQKWPEVWSSLQEWLENLPEAELDRDLYCRRNNGKDFCISRWELLRHIVNHSTLHRGQIMGMLRALGKQPPNTDLFTYYLEIAPAT
jgi:uncharacterized damage-inducible protein DinB